MTILEKKVDAIARSLLERNDIQRDRALAELKQLMSGCISAGTVREEIDTILTELGIPSRVVGFRYLAEAIYLGLDQSGPVKRGLIKGLYTETARVCGTTVSKMERAIRHAVVLCFDRGDPDVIKTYFGSTVSPHTGKLTNGEFIMRLCSVVRHRVGGM